MASKFIKNSAGNLTEEEALVTSAGAGDSGKIPALDAAGKLSLTMMPVGVGEEARSITASENLAAGDLVNLHLDTTLKMRKADASNGRKAHGFVEDAVTSAAAGVFYSEGINSGMSGLTVGANYFLSATAGLVAATAPSGSGQIVQKVGVALSATELLFEASQPITLA